MPLKVNYIYQFAVKLFVDLYFKLIKINKSKAKKICIYTDSRGFYVNKWYCKKNPLLSYIKILANTYYVDYHLCKYKHTTLLDFLYDYESMLEHKKYDVIILHLGVVDFSPRPLSQANEVLGLKKSRLQNIFSSDSLRNLAPWEYAERYNGEITASLYSKEFLKDFIVRKINNLNARVIWIGVNQILTDWNGNYDKERPANINNILDYQQIIDENFYGELISLCEWKDEDIKRYTVDNIHLSIEGFKHLANLINHRLR